jgi:hypothetical protein
MDLEHLCYNLFDFLSREQTCSGQIDEQIMRFPLMSSYTSYHSKATIKHFSRKTLVNGQNLYFKNKNSKIFSN